MASTRKGGKKASRKASKKAKSSKATAARSGKATTARKGTVTDGPPGGGVDHPPVIITDSSESFGLTGGSEPPGLTAPSAAIGLDENEFPRIPSTGNTRVSTGLRLISVGANRLHPDTGSPACYTLDDDERVEIRVTCRIGGGGNERSFTITGGNSNDPADSPRLVFSHGVFPAGVLVAGRRMFRNANRQIVRMEIFSPPGSNNRVHDCSVASTLTNYEITVFDDHVEDD